VPAFRERFEHGKVRGAGLVEAGDQGVHRAYAAPWGDDEPGPALAGVYEPAPVGYCLQGPNPGRANRNDLLAGSTRGAYESSGLQRDAVELLIRRLVVFEAGNAGVQYERRDLHALRDKTGDKLRCERPPRGGHLSAAHFRGVDCLVIARRPLLFDVAIANRTPLPLEVLIELHLCT
jgi:hypothetical protein